MRILHKSRRAVPLIPAVAELIELLVSTPTEVLSDVLAEIDHWKWPRSDLNAWVKVLNKFDHIMEDIIRDYEIDKIQHKPFLPFAKKTLCEILRFSRLLLENSTNRKTYNSYDRLSHLMTTADLDVLVFALNLLLRPAQQYSAQPAVSHALSLSTSRLATLSKRWPNLHDFDITLVAIAGENGKTRVATLPNEAREVSFTFYRKDGSSKKEKEKAPEVDPFEATPQPPQTPRKGGPATTPGASASTAGPVLVHIDSQTLETKPTMQIWEEAIQAYSVPEEEKFELLWRIRTAQAFTAAHSEDREKLVIIRLLAISLFCHTHPEGTTFNSVFLYEPDLVHHIAELLQLDQGVDIQVQTSAIYALDAVGRYRNKIQDVLTAVNAGVNHGALMALLRKTVVEIAHPESTIPQAFVEALLTFVTYIAAHTTGGNMVVGAGLVPLLAQIIDIRHANRLYALSKTMLLLDNLLYGYVNSFQLFCNARGIDVLVGRIEYEVDLGLEEHGEGKPSAEVPISHGKISVARATVLKHVMRSMHRMMQSSGTSEGLRGLLDSSLLKSTKKVLENRDVFGANVLAMAINIMSTFIHNEPTCLAVIQEAGLPEAFYSVVESGLEPIIEVVQAVPNAVGALCLNQTGQDQLAARPGIVPALFSIFTSEKHQRMLQEKENAVIIGTGVEELVRHHPALKTAISESIMATLAKIEELGNAYVVPEESKQWYTLRVIKPQQGATPTVPHDSTEAATTATSQPSTSEPASAPPSAPVAASPSSVATPASAPASAPAPAPAPVSVPAPVLSELLHHEDVSSKSHDNLIVSFIDAFSKFLEGYFQHIPHCRDFISSNHGLDRLGRLTALPCLPYDFANSVASDSLVQVVRTMVEASTSDALAFIVKLVNASLAETAYLRDDSSGESKFVALATAEDEAAATEATEGFRKLITLHVRIMLLSDIYATTSYSQSRGLSTLIQSLVGRGSGTLLLGLGGLHRSCVWENGLLKAELSLGNPDSQGMPFNVMSLAAPSMTPATATASPAEPAAETNGSSQPEASTAPTTSSPPKINQVKEANLKALKHIASQLPNGLTPFFQSLVRLFHTRRNPDPTQKQRILDASNVASDVAVKHLSLRSTDDKRSLLTYYATMINQCSMLLIDERTNQRIINSVLMTAFHRKGGLDAIIELSRIFIASIQEITPIAPEERSEIQVQTLIHAQSGLKVALGLIHPIISSKPILESPQTALLLTPDKKDTELGYFSPQNFMVQLRVAVIPFMKEIWTSSWLISAPLGVSKSVIQVILELLNTEGEEIKDSPADPTASLVSTIPRTLGPDENRIRQLTDMGFPRSAAERALARVRNNVSAATELLLAQPFPLPPDPNPAEPAAGAAPAEGAAPEAAPAAAVEGAASTEGGAPAEGAAPENDAPPVLPDAPTSAAILPPATETEAASNASAAPAEASASSQEPPTPPSVPVTIKSHEEWLKELNEARESLKDGIGGRALSLIDEHPALVFEAQRVFVGPSTAYRDDAVRLLVDNIKSFSGAAYDHQEQPLSVRCRLLALVCNDPSSPLSSMAEADAKKLMDVLIALLLSNPVNVETRHPTVPKWLAALLLVIETLLMMGEEPRTVTIPKEDELIKGEAEVMSGPWHTEARATTLDFCLRLLQVPSLPRDELLSALRLFVLLTRNHATAIEFMNRDGVAALFRLLKDSPSVSNASGVHSYIASILRHIVEDPTTLQSIMQQEIKTFFSHPRNRVPDVSTFVRSCSALALRDPKIFIKASAEMCQFSVPYGPLKNISLKTVLQPGLGNTASVPDDGTTPMQIDPPAPQRSAPSESLDTFVHFLINELMKSVKSEQISEPATPGPRVTEPAVGSVPEAGAVIPSFDVPKDSASQMHDLVYSCFIMQCLTELLFSYDSCKIAFLSYSPKKRVHATPSKESGYKHRTAALQFLISELLSFGTINANPPPEAKHQVTLCNWAMSVIVALCVDTSPTDMKDVPPERASVRKFVLEAINRAIKDLPSSEVGEARYSRLLALADLCYRLLTVRFNNGTRKANDETPTHIAKVMLEKNFVATLTNALAEVDPNFPDSRGVVTGILRPLEYLTKIAIKMSRPSDKQKDVFANKTESVGSGSELSGEDEDEEMEDATHRDAPDLYRNSSLGMYGGEMDDVHYNRDEEMDDDGEEEDEDAEMDYDDETASEDTSNTEEDEEAALEEEMAHETGESEGWHDDDEEDDLIEHEDHDGGEDDDDDDDDDDEADDAEVMWEDVAVVQDGAVVGEDIDAEEHDEDMAMMGGNGEEEEDGDMLSEADDYADDLDGIYVQDEGALAGPHAVFGIEAEYAPADAGGNAPEAAPFMSWRNAMRTNNRRREDDTAGMLSRPRSNQAPEGAVHPLLLDPTNTGPSSHSRASRRQGRGIAVGLPQEFINTIEHAIGEQALQFVQHVLTGRAIGPGGETIQFNVPAGGLQLGRNGRTGLSAHIRVERARPGDNRSEPRGFEPLLTGDRWSEEVKTLHGKFEQVRSAKLAYHVILALLPAAAEAHKKAKLEEEKEAARRKAIQEIAEEEAKRKEEEEKARAEEEKAKAEQERLEAEARAAAEAAERAAATAPIADTDAEMVDATVEPASEGNAEASSSANVEQTGSSSAPERVVVTIHGNQVDITDTGIDPTFLEALPDDMREEVLNQHIRDQRAARVERPADSQISPEFLDALPPELRAEIIQQENIERARRRAEQAAVQAPPAPVDMAPADFFASLEPALRQSVLMESDDMFIDALPADMLAEVGIFREAQQAAARAQAAANSPPVTRRTQPQAPPPPPKPPTPREAIQLLDKHSIAVLIRLLFFPQVLRKNILSKVLVNLSENTKTRTDIFNLLLNILHDGTGDLSSIDKSFAQMSFRNTKAFSLTPRASGKAPFPQPEVVPELVAQRCLDALTYITATNEASSMFFVTEQEVPAGLRRIYAVKGKGKGKEKQTSQTYYPIVLLLGQLTRQALLRTPSLMESVVQLLSLVSKPLVGLIPIPSDGPEEGSSERATTAASSTAPAAAAPTSNTPAPSASAPAPVASSTPTVSGTPTAPNAPSAASTSAASGASMAPSASATAQPTAPKAALAQPPVASHNVLRLVVNILTIGECSGRAFSHTLALIQQLSFIPGARDVIASELCAKAQEFGQRVYTSLDELAAALQESRGDDVAIAVASKFSLASSDQAKLLRVLKTIDYMFSTKPNTSSAEVSNEDIEKVQAIYESFRFTPLWRRLGDCLTIIEEKTELENIATVLLPLIESLMVVCKYVGPKASNAIMARAVLSSMSPRTPTTPRESMEDLFVSFTDAHRKVLNLMVRNNPSLMSGSFSLLVNNPRVLDFDNKRNYFSQQVHRRPHGREAHHNTLQLNVRRQRVFEDSFQYLQRKTGDQIKYGKLSVRFYDEEGVDAGGVTREWFQILARQMFDPNYCLFQPCAADRLTYQPNKASSINPEHLSFFKFVGRIIGKAIYDGRLLDAYFARSLYRQILGKPVDYRDVEWVDPTYYNSLCWILENDPTALDLTFSAEADEFGVTKLVELKEGGATIPVTQENKREFVQLSASYRLYSSIKEQIEALLAGFYEIIPKDLIQIFDEKELELLISGTPDIDVDEWRAATEYNGYTSSDPAIVWFWRALKSFNREERAKVLSFATGTSRVPLGGFVELQGVQGVQRFSIHKAYGEVDRLPQAHTCFNQIDLPQYSSYEMLRQQLLLAIHEGGEGFGFA